ncbi:FeoA family protein [Floridanema aerugineum]|jgi:ferrous iron transport protein A|uniref:Ferrous iron transport protein A n=1 Tax=Floridaenema aerugineum BLCC-F46 TaxID=3153654 RepID=A0ABV4X2E3_9CYAN
MTLSELKPGSLAIVESVQLSRHGQGLAKRLEAMGIVPNRPIRVLRQAWFGGPLHIRVGSTTEIAIRRTEAKMVLIQTMEATN